MIGSVEWGWRGLFNLACPSFARVVAACVITWGLGLKPARADEVPSTAWCTLSRSPFLPELVLPESLQCKFDQDGNGLDDEIEREIARCVTPQFRFDSRESDRRPDEPNLVFSAYRTGLRTILIRFVALFRNDGGFVLDDDFGCGDDHEGDTQGISVSVVIDGRNVSLYEVSAGPTTTISGSGEGKTELFGSHPVIYPTAGKHHWWQRPGSSCYDVSPGGCCNDEANGAGARVIPGFAGVGQVTHLPAQGYCLGPGEDYECERDSGGSKHIDPRFRNICALGRLESLPLEGFQGPLLENLGYDGQQIFRCFYSCAATPVWAVVGGPINLDGDADGEWDSYYAHTDGPQIDPPTDLCPWSAGGDDDDADGLIGACDPSPEFRNTYVAGGDEDHPSRFGYLDTDSDGAIDGVDSCPSVRFERLFTHGPNWNEPAERVNFAADPDYRDLGRFLRGNECDPYPATYTSWDISTSGETTCTDAGLVVSTGGSDVVSFDVDVSAGRSANDPNRPIPREDSYLAQAFRCACTEPGDCLLDLQSPCYATAAGPAAETPTIPDGAGYRPVDNRTCARDASGYCLPVEVSNGASQNFVWHWRAETSSRPHHFLPGEILRNFLPTSGLGLPSYKSDIALASDYAVMGLVIEGASFDPTTAPGQAFPQLATSLYPEPEFTEAGAALLSTTSLESRRLRASFVTEQPIVSPYRFVNDLIPEACLLEIPSCAPGCFDADPRLIGWGPDPVQPIDRLWLWRSPREFFGDGRLVQPVSRKATAPRIDASFWAATARGLGAALTPRDAGTASYPEFLWVERVAARSRWAVLAPAASEPSSVPYIPREEGVLVEGVSVSGWLIADERGRTVALIDPERKTITGFEPDARIWINKLPQLTELFARTESAWTLVGSNLFVIGGKSGSTVHADGWILDVLEGTVRPWSFGLPARRGARLQQTADGAALWFAGGRDAAGVLHDDVWLMDLAGDGLLAAHRVFVDSSRASSFDPKTVLFGSRTQRSLRAWQQAASLAVTEQRRASSGWSLESCPPRDLAAYTLFATNELRVNDGADVRAGSDWAGVASSGSLTTNIGVNAHVGSIISKASVLLRNNAKVHGGIVSGGQIEAQAGATATGTLLDEQALPFSTLQCAIPQSFVTGPAVMVEPAQQRTLAPGNYSTISVKSGATLNLPAGDYFATSFMLEPQGTVRFDTAARPVRIYVKTAFSFKGSFVDTTGQTDRILVVYAGTTAAAVESRFLGTIVAPNATIDLKSVTAPGHTGTFFGKRVELHQNTTLSRAAFVGRWSN